MYVCVLGVCDKNKRRRRTNFFAFFLYDTIERNRKKEEEEYLYVRRYYGADGCHRATIKCLFAHRVYTAFTVNDEPSARLGCR